jgi:hypothetical protein
MDVDEDGKEYSLPAVAGFSMGKTDAGNNDFVMMPTWFPVTVAAILAVTPWIRSSKRFGLRTLLIATTLVALVLGIIVWKSRAG